MIRSAIDGPNTLGPRFHCSRSAASDSKRGSPLCKPSVDDFLSTGELYAPFFRYLDGFITHELKAARTYSGSPR